MRGRPPPEPEDDVPEDLRSRGDARREQKRAEERLMRLATRLAELPERQLGKLSLPDPVLDAVLDARAVRDPAPRHRALRVVRIALRDSDPGELERRLRDVNERRCAPAPRQRRRRGRSGSWTEGIRRSTRCSPSTRTPIGGSSASSSAT